MGVSAVLPHKAASSFLPPWRGSLGWRGISPSLDVARRMTALDVGVKRRGDNFGYLPYASSTTSTHRTAVSSPAP